jgi:hypothetical protein
VNGRLIRDAYLGNVDFRNKRVLEIGPASGFFSFYMEREGAEVISLELGRGQPSGGLGKTPDLQSFDSDPVDVSRKRRNNSFWFAHRAFNSKVRVVYGNVYETPAAIGPVHIATFGNVLLFLPRARDLSEPGRTWWGLSPGIVKLFLAVLGFRQSSVSYHTQRFRETDRIPHFTVVGHRTDKI